MEGGQEDPTSARKRGGRPRIPRASRRHVAMTMWATEAEAELVYTAARRNRMSISNLLLESVIVAGFIKRKNTP